MKKIIGLIGLFVLAFVLFLSVHDYASPVRIDDDVGITTSLDDAQNFVYTSNVLAPVSQSVSDPLMFDTYSYSAVDHTKTLVFDPADVQGTTTLELFKRERINVLDQFRDKRNYAYRWQTLSPG